MTEACSEQGDRLAPYIDGELDVSEAEAFALHLAGCRLCRDALHDALQLAALETRAGSNLAGSIDSARATAARAPSRVKPRTTRERARRWSRTRLAISVAATAGVALAAIWLVTRSPAGKSSTSVPGRDAPVVLETAEARAVEGRVAYAAADRHRRYNVSRAGTAAPGAQTDAIGLPTLARLEERGDMHGVAAAYLLLGDAARARGYLERAAASSDVEADRALVLLTTGAPAEALVALDGVLDKAPRHPQALWNRALALRDLGLPLLASEAFTSIAELGEPGWADEGRERAKALSDQTAERKAPIDEILAAGPKLATAPDGVRAELARRVPGTTRLYFYDAVRGAASADAVRALAPLARTLDTVNGGDALARYVERTARADFKRRGPLAARYARVVAGERLDPAGARDLLGALRAARQDDILLGALVLTSPDRRTVPPALLPEFRRLAEATGDPWFRVAAAEQEAGALIARGEFEAAEALMLPALAGCTLDFRCTRLALVLGDNYLLMQRLSDARRVIGDGIARARRTGEWLLEQRFLAQLADLVMLQDEVEVTTLPLARAYVGELVRRDRRCTTELWGREEIATMLNNREAYAAARHELARAEAIAVACPAATSSIQGVLARAQVARDDQVAGVRAEVARLRAAPSSSPGIQAALDQVEGLVLLDPTAADPGAASAPRDGAAGSSARDPAAGRALLERAIAASRSLPGDVNAHKARSYAYALLTLDAGRAGEWERVWQLLVEEAGSAAGPTAARGGGAAGGTIARCALGVAVQGRRSVVVVRDAAGALAGAYDASRVGAARDTVSIPTALRDRLRGCPEIDVLARPPVEGSPALLPIEVAWSYRSRAAGSDAEPSRGARLVISNAEPPAELGLPRLLPWRSAAAPEVALDGAAATPSRALAALADVGFVEIHAHGMMNAAISDASFLMLSPDAGGHYALTAAAIRKQPLRGRPIVILAACHAGATAPYRHEPWGLPAAFVEAGARAVIASPDVIADADAGAFFDEVRARIERGTSPAVALHDVRLEWLAAHPGAAWVRSLMVFR
jgi:tetratricopeptide (TPR) repeat protein